MRCCVKNCINDSKEVSKDLGITFHLFPKDPDLHLAWTKALGLPVWDVKEGSIVCLEHFHSDDIFVTKSGMKKIKNGAVPVDCFENLEVPATMRVCRICLAIDTKFYHIRDSKLDLIYEYFSEMPISVTDKLPVNVCWECAHRLNSSWQFKSKVIHSQRLMVEALDNVPYLTIRDIKSISRTQSILKPTLISRYYDPNDCDIHYNDNEIVKKETEQFCSDDEFKDNFEEVTEMIPPIMEVEIKDEQNNGDIFLEEYIDNFESDDDRKLSEVISQKRIKKLKTLKKVKKKKLKAEKPRAVRTVKKREPKKDEEDTPLSLTDKYKTADVKRRRTQEAPDENLFTISSITYEEQIEEIEKRQETASYKNAPYKCVICYRGFVIKDRYDAHVVRHTEASGSFECFICKTRLKTGRALRKHLTAQHTEMFSCKGCPFTTRNRGVAREHEKWHAGTKYQCPHCPSEFDKVTTYMGHIRIKHASDFVCELCGYTFVSKKGIEVHKKKKHKMVDKSTPVEGPYCEVCDVRFLNDDAHARHLRLSSRHSSESDPNRLRNDSQSMNSERNGRVVRRVERRPNIHPREPGQRERENEPGPVTCEQCGIQLRDLRLYAQHFRRAHPDKNRTKYPAMKTPCMCEQCGRIFQSMALLKDHMWVHTGEKRFKCDRCDKSFTQKTNLMFHARVHSAARPSYECPLCGKHFAFYNNRRRHMFIHTGLKPFKCDTCGKCFTTSGEQRAHIEHVHLKKPWPKRVRQRQLDWQQKCVPGQMED